MLKYLNELSIPQKPLKVMSIFGTRPEAIKMAPLIIKMKQEPRLFSPIVVDTGQHHEMLLQVLKVFNIKPDYNLNIMQPNQTLSQITTRVLNKLDKLLDKHKPDIILVHGDTTTTLAAALSAFYHKIPIGHVESGLRTYHKYSPYPEEMNRRIVDQLADLHFAPTKLSKHNLLKENFKSDQIVVTGNTAIDALRETLNKYQNLKIFGKIPSNHKIVLLTMHRRENRGKPMVQVFRTIKQVLNKYKNLDVVYPVHLSPEVKEIANTEFKNCTRVHLLPPLDVVRFHTLMAHCYFVMTDSGGIQEEAPALNKPVLVLRDSTERTEGVKAGTLKVIGTRPKNVRQAMISLLTNQNLYNKMAHSKNPYGDGHATDRILKTIRISLDAMKIAKKNK